jgi:hypothetical protein
MVYLSARSGFAVITLLRATPLSVAATSLRTHEGLRSVVSIVEYEERKSAVIEFA